MVKNILGMVAGGYSIERIIEAYPELSREDVTEALEYACEVIDEENPPPEVASVAPQCYTRKRRSDLAGS